MKRRIASILLLLISGAIVNIAVAWASVYWSSGLGIPEFEELDHAASMCYWNELALLGWSTPHELAGVQAFLSVGVSDGFVQELTSSNMRAIAWQEHGIPFRTLRATIHIDGLEVVRDKRWRFHGRSFPTQPILPGTLINTILYTVLLWLMFAVPLRIRRMLRRRRGLCEKCAYPIGVSPVCTECGAALPWKNET